MMAGRFAIYATAAAAIASVSGWALGNFATTTAKPTSATFDIQNTAYPETGAEAHSETGSAQLAAADMAPDHIPVCRKGCGPALGQRETGAYFDDGSSQLDKIYGAGDNDDSHDSAAISTVSSRPEQSSSPTPTPEVAPTAGGLHLPD